MRVSKHGAGPSFETHRFAMLLRMRAERGAPRLLRRDYIAAWKFRVGTGAGGRGGACSVNQPATERAAHCGIR